MRVKTYNHHTPRWLGMRRVGPFYDSARSPALRERDEYSITSHP